jgi:hypothetical protein
MAHRENAAEVHADHLIEQFRRRLFDRSVALNPSRADQHIHGLVPLSDLSGCTFYRGRFGYVHGYRLDTPARVIRPLRQRGQRGRVSIERHDDVAVGCEPLDHRQPNARGTTGNDAHSALVSRHH